MIDLEEIFFKSADWESIHTEIIDNPKYPVLTKREVPRPLPKKKCYPEKGVVKFYKYSYPYSLVIWKNTNSVAELYMSGGELRSVMYIRNYDLKQGYRIDDVGRDNRHKGMSLYQIIMMYVERPAD